MVFHQPDYSNCFHGIRAFLGTSNCQLQVQPLNSLPLLHFSPANFIQLISIKLDGNNHLIWLSQFLSVLHNHDLMGIVNGSEMCPKKFSMDDLSKEVLNFEFTFLIKNKKDQYILSWINVNTMSEKVSIPPYVFILVLMEFILSIIFLKNK